MFSDTVFFVHGTFDGFGRDPGVSNTMNRDDQGLWQYEMMAELSPFFHVRIQRVNKNNKSCLPREVGEEFHNLTAPGYLSPLPLLETVAGLDGYPSSPHLGYRITVNDTDQRYYLSPVGSWENQIAIYILLGAVPILTGFASICIYQYAFYTVESNKLDRPRKKSILPTTIPPKVRLDYWLREIYSEALNKEIFKSLRSLGESSTEQSYSVSSPRRTILIATRGYEINDWDIRIDNGSPGTTPHLMSKNLAHLDLVWVVPCRGGIVNPEDQRTNPITVTVFGSGSIVQVQYHRLRNTTFLLLDTPTFRAQAEEEPYPRRMEDIDTAFYCFSWYVFAVL